MKKFEEPIFKIVNITSSDVISTSIEEEHDNKGIKIASLFDGDYIENNWFV